MTSIVSGVDYNVLFSGASSTLGASNAVLGALYSGNANGATPATTFVSTGNPVTDLKLAQKQQTRGVAEEGKQPLVQSAIALFKKAVANAKSVKDALANPYVQQVLLTANGLSNYIGQTALVQKAFLSDPNDSKSLVNQLKDSSLLAAVRTYDFAKNGVAELKNAHVQTTLANAYAEVQWRKGLNQATPGLSEALDFQAGAGSIKTVSDVLSNPSYFDLITTALGIPRQIVNQDVQEVNGVISARLDFTKLKDANYVNSLTDTYLLTMQQQNSPSSGSASLESLAVKALSITA